MISRKTSLQNVAGFFVSAKELKERGFKFFKLLVCHVFMHCSGSFLLHDTLLNLHEFAFQGKNMKLNVNMLLTCFLHCAPGPGYD